MTTAAMASILMRRGSKAITAAQVLVREDPPRASCHPCRTDQAVLAFLGLWPMAPSLRGASVSAHIDAP